VIRDLSSDMARMDWPDRISAFQCDMVCKTVEFLRASGVHGVEKLCVLVLLWRCRVRPPYRSFCGTA
jgi:hypothetical protein